METERFVLRPYKKSDAIYIFKNWASDPEVTKFLSFKPHESIEVTKNVLKDWLDQEKLGPTHRFCIVFKGTDEPIGAIDIVKRDDKSGDIGYILSRKYWNQGIMTEVCSAYVNYLFDQGFEEIYIRAAEANIGSNRVIEKCGFTFLYKEKAPLSKIKPEIITLNCYKMSK